MSIGHWMPSHRSVSDGTGKHESGQPELTGQMLHAIGWQNNGIKLEYYCKIILFILSMMKMHLQISLFKRGNLAS